MKTIVHILSHLFNLLSIGLLDDIFGRITRAFHWPRGDASSVSLKTLFESIPSILKTEFYFKTEIPVKCRNVLMWLEPDCKISQLKRAHPDKSIEEIRSEIPVGYTI